MNSRDMIIGGPSKFDLMLALFDSKFPDFRSVTFTLGNGHKFEANITGVSMEDGSSNSWLFTANGHIASGTALYTGDRKRVAVSGCYSTTNRAGHIAFPK